MNYQQTNFTFGYRFGGALPQMSSTSIIATANTPIRFGRNGGLPRRCLPRHWRRERALRCAGAAGRDCDCERVDAPQIDVLARARKHVEEYFDKFSDLTCKESVTQLF